MTRCPVHRRRLIWSSAKGLYCWSCENRARQEVCEHVFNDKRFRGILGYRHFCGRCGAMYVGPVDEYGDPVLKSS